MIFLTIKDSSGNERRVNLIADKFPMILNDGEADMVTNTSDFISDNNGDPEVVEAVTKMLHTRKEQPVGMGFTIRLR